MKEYEGSRARRVDIDLLRAVAVLAVLLYHFDVPGFNGGFLGVDIFFVISGYLITLHIQDQLKNQDFSFTLFYLRRIRRLYPAMVVTLLLSSITAAFILPKLLLEEFSRSQIASAAYVSNLYFWSISDYFDTESILKPLLHTWSLAVEEQFYLIWPLFIALTFKHRQQLAIVLALAVSVLAAEFAWSNSPSLAFYWFPFRVFEFAAGALVCRYSAANLSPRLKDGALVAAILVIAVSLLVFDEGIRNPGFITMPLCIGTAVVIALNHHWFSKQSRVIDFFLRIGLTSYSAYLVHWPLVVFYKLAWPGELSLMVAGLLIAVTLILAELMYRFVERPTARLPLVPRRAVWFGLVPAVLVVSILIDRGYPTAYSYLNPPEKSVQTILDEIPNRREITKLAKQAVSELQLNTSLEPQTRIVVVGDSHSIDVYYALQLALASERFQVDLINSICDPLTIASIFVPLEKLYENHVQRQTHEPSYCEPIHKDFLRNLISNDPHILIFSEAWRRDALAYLPATLGEIKSNLSDVKIVLLGRNFQLRGIPQILFGAFTNLKLINEEAWNFRYKALDALEPALKQIADEAGVVFVSKADIVCPINRCRILIEDQILYSDTQHWTVPGMHYYGRHILEKLIDEGLFN